MSFRSLFAVFAALTVIEGSLIFPQVSSAQQLAETAAAATIQGDLHRRSGSYVLGAAGRARSVAGTANQKRREDNKWLQETPAPQAQPGAGRNSKEFDEQLAQPGKVYVVTGHVVSDGPVNGRRVILVARPNETGGVTLCGFIPRERSLPNVPVETRVTATGKYESRVKDKRTGMDVFGFGDAAVVVLQNDQETVAPDAQDTPAEEKQTFDTVLKGWTYRGMVKVSGKTTGVFVNEESVRYAQPGTELAEGVVVRKFSGSLARVTVDGKTVDVAPW
ncbi:MAG: hypothetical protein JNM34_08500 [Chthonomonadaceae bacterium]|nr:hypothetical protein [Chthonomonadaceae bacterium]